MQRKRLKYTHPETPNEFEVFKKGQKKWHTSFIVYLSKFNNMRNDIVEQVIINENIRKYIRKWSLINYRINKTISLFHISENYTLHRKSKRLDKEKRNIIFLKSMGNMDKINEKYLKQFALYKIANYGALFWLRKCTEKQSKKYLKNASKKVEKYLIAKIFFKKGEKGKRKNTLLPAFRKWRRHVKIAQKLKFYKLVLRNTYILCRKYFEGKYFKRWHRIIHRQIDFNDKLKKLGKFNYAYRWLGKATKVTHRIKRTGTILNIANTVNDKFFDHYCLQYFFDKWKLNSVKVMAKFYQQ